MRSDTKMLTAIIAGIIAITNAATAITTYYVTATDKMKGSVSFSVPQSNTVAQAMSLPDMKQIEDMFDKKLAPFLTQLAEAKKAALEAKEVALNSQFIANQAKSDSELVKAMMVKDMSEFRSDIGKILGDTREMVGALRAKGILGG